MLALVSHWTLNTTWMKCQLQTYSTMHTAYTLHSSSILQLVYSVLCSGIENAKSEKEKQLKEMEQGVRLWTSRLDALTAPHCYNRMFCFVPTPNVHI